MKSNDRPHKAARIVARIPQVAVAAHLGVHVATVKRLEKQPPEDLTIKEVDAYACLTGFDRDQVIGRSPLPEASNAS
jgi:hypothetical protein